MKTLNQSNTILEVSFVQFPLNLMASQDEGYFKIIYQSLKENVSIQKFELFDNPRLQNIKCPLIQQELDANDRNKIKLRQFLQLENQEDTTFEGITIKNIKLCLKFNVQIVIEELSDDDLEQLEYYLQHPQHKVVILDISSPALPQSQVDKIIEVLNKRSVYSSNIDIIKLGKRKYDDKSLITTCKWILNKYSTRNEREYFNVKDYLLSFSHILSFNEKEDEDNKKQKEGELELSNDRRRNIKTHFIMDKDGTIKKKAEKTETQIILEIDRKLSSDSYK